MAIHHAFSNLGTLNKSANAAVTTFQTAVDNANNVHVTQGTLSLQAGGVLDGAYTITAPGKLTVGNDTMTPTSAAFPSVFTSGNWSGTFSGTATDSNGHGIVSVGFSIFDGVHYFDGAGFNATTESFLPAILSGNTWTFTIPLSTFKPDTARTFHSLATDNNNAGVDASAITQPRPHPCRRKSNP